MNKIPTPNLQKIIDYYQSNKLDYQLYNLSSRNISLHFGLWDKKTHTPKQALLNENYFLLKLSGIQSRHHILDLGCGYGATSVWLASRVGCKTTGITLGSEQVNSAQIFSKQQKVNQLTEFLNMDFHHMNFPDATFDLIIAIESLCHSQDKRQVLKECYRVLKPGGRMIVADSFFKRKKTSLSPNERQRLISYFNMLQIHDLSELEEFRGIIEESGFSQIEWLEKTAFVLPALKRLRLLSSISPFLFYLGKFFGLNLLNPRHAKAFLSQYTSLKEGICAYGFWKVEKP